MLTGAIEGGSGYWAELPEEAHKIINSVVKPNKELTFVDRVWKTLNAPKAIPIYSKEEGEIVGELSLKSIREGEAIMQEDQSGHFCDIIKEEDDAITADVWFQFAVVKELRYG